MHTYWVHNDIKCTFYGRDGYYEWWMMWCYWCRCCSIHVLLLWNERATEFICKTATHIYTRVDRALSIDNFAPPNDVTSSLSGLIYPFPAFGYFDPMLSVTFRMMHTQSETYVWMWYKYLSFISISILFLGFLSCDGLKADLHHVERRK